LVTENEKLKGKVELIDLWHHQIEEFETFKMEHVFISVKLFIYNKRLIKFDWTSGSIMSPELPN